MTQTIKAIETRYKGYRFRSRLEARWAVFFDALGVEYRYEPEGFEKPKGDGSVLRCLPDFYLPQSKTWVEVKGCLTIDSVVKLGEFLDYGCPLDGFSDSDVGIDHQLFRLKYTSGLLVLGDIPEPRHGLYLHPLITHRKGLFRRSAFFTTFGPAMATWDFLAGLEVASDQDLRPRYLDSPGEDVFADPERSLALFQPAPLFVPAKRAYRPVTAAYAAARSARFEFGECGATA